MFSSASVRPLRPGDGEAVVAMFLANRTRFENGGLAMLPTTVGEYGKWIADPAVAHGHALKVVYGIWAVEAGAPRLAGFVGIETLNRFNGAGIGYGIDKTFQGRGLAKSGVLLAMADFGARAEEAGLAQSNRWVLHVHKSNLRSLALCASLGFRPDEVLDYTRQVSARGGQRFLGHFSQRSLDSIASEASARQLAGQMLEHAGAIEAQSAHSRRRLAA